MAWIQATTGTIGWVAGLYNGKKFLTSTIVGTRAKVQNVSPDLILRSTPAGTRKDSYGLAPDTEVLIKEKKTVNNNVWCRILITKVPGYVPPEDEIPPEEKSDAEKCFAEGKYWYDSACHDKPKSKFEWKKILPPVLIGVGVLAVLIGTLRGRE